MSETCPTDEVHCTCVPILKRENERLKTLAGELVEALKDSLPGVKADAISSHLIEGFYPKRNEKDDFADHVEGLIAKAKEVL